MQAFDSEDWCLSIGHPRLLLSFLLGNRSLQHLLNFQVNSIVILSLHRLSDKLSINKTFELNHTLALLPSPLMQKFLRSSERLHTTKLHALHGCVFEGAALITGQTLPVAQFPDLVKTGIFLTGNDQSANLNIISCHLLSHPSLQ